MAEGDPGVGVDFAAFQLAPLVQRTNVCRRHSWKESSRAPFPVANTFEPSNLLVHVPAKNRLMTCEWRRCLVLNHANTMCTFNIECKLDYLSAMKGGACAAGLVGFGVSGGGAWWRVVAGGVPRFRQELLARTFFFLREG